VPRVNYFYGITVRMYWDERDHPIPHFHAEYAGSLASIAIDGTVLGWSLPSRALRLVRARAALHAEEQFANWEHARNHEPPATIDPLA
jgi:hypothetical protein